MATIDISQAVRPKRRRREGMDSPRAESSPFFDRMPPSAQRHVFIRQSVLFKNRGAPVNSRMVEMDDPGAITKEIKQRVLNMGADIVGVAEYLPELTFGESEILAHKCIVVFGMKMKFDYIVDIGPNSQSEVHRVYYELDDIGIRLSHYIGACGYEARTQPNIGDIPLPAYGWLAGLGELGKHGSLISPELGSSFRLSALSTEMPLIVDGPKDHGIDEVCANCQICARFCPGNAIKHEKKEVAGVERWYVDTPACEPYFFECTAARYAFPCVPLTPRVFSRISSNQWQGIFERPATQRA